MAQKRELVVAVADSIEPQHSTANPIGRDYEHRLLSEAFETVDLGNGRLFLVGGEAGIGKTTLVERFLAGARAREATVLTGTSYDVASPPPYAPWSEALLSLRDTDDGRKSLQWLDGEHLSSLPDQTALFRDVQHRLEQIAKLNRLVLVLEDIHWADRESLELLRFVGRSVRNVPALIIATYRNDEISPEHPLYQVLPHLVREARAERIDLRPHSRSAIREMVESRYQLSRDDRERLVDELERRTEGNPFFIVELLRSLEMSNVLSRNADGWTLGSLSGTGTPLLIRQVIDRRLLQLDEPARAALQSAAVIGQEIDADLWLAVADQDEAGLADIIQQALDAYLLEQSPHSEQLRFRHAIVRETLYASLPLPWRKLRHRRIAEALTMMTDRDPATIVEHFSRAGDPRLAEWSLRAARRAAQLYAPHTVLQHLTAAVERCDSLPPEAAMEAHRLRGWANETVGEFSAAQRDYQCLLRTAEETDDHHAQWDALMRLAQLWAGRDYERTIEYVEQALGLSERIEDDTLRAHSLNRLGNWYLNSEFPDRARKNHQDALTIFQRLGDQSGAAATYDLLGMASYMGGDLIGGTRYYERAVDLFQSLDNRQGLCSSLANLSMRGVTYQTDTMVAARTTLDDCIADAQQALSVATEIAWRAGEVYALIRLGFVLGSRGEYQRAIEISHQSIAEAEEIGHRQWLVAACCLAGTLYVDLLDPAMAQVHLERGRIVAGETGSRHWIRSTSALLASACLELGEIRDAQDVLQSALQDDPPPQTLAQRLAWCARIQLELAQGNPEAALDLVDQVIAATPHANQEHPPVRLAMLRAEALLALERFDDADEWLRPTLLIAREQGARPVLWRIHRALGRIQSSRGQRPSSTGSFAEARRLIEELSAGLEEPERRTHYWAAALNRLPETRASTSLQAAKQSYGGLTRRQREVATLIADGCSNRTIADRLSISERTVESHVTAIFATLSLESRSQVAAWAVQQGLYPNSQS